MINIVRQVTLSCDVTFITHTYSVTDKLIYTTVDLTFDGKSLLDNEPVELNKEDLANLIQILTEAQNTGQ